LPHFKGNDQQATDLAYKMVEEAMSEMIEFFVDNSYPAQRDPAFNQLKLPVNSTRVLIPPALGSGPPGLFFGTPQHVGPGEKWASPPLIKTLAETPVSDDVRDLALYVLQFGFGDKVLNGKNYFGAYRLVRRNWQAFVEGLRRHNAWVESLFKD
jgi:hypothetical protein